MHVSTLRAHSRELPPCFVRFVFFLSLSLGCRPVGCLFLFVTSRSFVRHGALFTVVVSHTPEPHPQPLTPEV
jgi:hypothetical protein